ncbi:hypothetical protein Smp_141130 [Schistosoma mansoni]|uniref:DET1- and DDB1-associated protein 1 n=1 Tax=Schistosoma mansoni TaxID=6183 RepID=G4V834_SCHMA|nr:hypothetical protein Smp_141130 [Schistosoma mansoni]|eukprot:XP_018647916.1 hypothetical protein Smp_141130 [Schistosoma mansoni]
MATYMHATPILPDPVWGQRGLHTDVRLIQMHMYESSSPLSSKLDFSEVDSLIHSHKLVITLSQHKTYLQARRKSA